MERMGLLTICVGIAIAIIGSLPFVGSVIAGTAAPNDLSANLIWQAWALGGVVSFVGMIVTMMGDGRSDLHNPMR